VIVKLTAPRGTAPDSPVVGPVGYLSVNGNEVRLVKAERGLFNTRVTDTVLAAVPQSSVASAALQRARLASRLHVEFRDGTTWEVDVPSRRRAVVDQVVSELSGTAA
jgi:hypothetical protein